MRILQNLRQAYALNRLYLQRPLYAALAAALIEKINSDVVLDPLATKDIVLELCVDFSRGRGLAGETLAREIERMCEMGALTRSDALVLSGQVRALLPRCE